MARRIRRWLWPVAFSTITGVAAVLLAMFAARPTTPIARNVQPSPAPAVAEAESAFEFEPARKNLSRPVFYSEGEQMSYLDVRDQVLCYGVESWDTPVPTVARSTSKPETPLSHREQLNRLLKQQGLNGS